MNSPIVKFFMHSLRRMFDWPFSLFGSSPEEPPVCPPLEPNQIPYEVSRVMLDKGTDAPFLSKYWDYPLKGPSAPEILYAEKIHHMPLFSSKDQTLNTLSKCVGKLHFMRSLHPDLINVSKVDKIILTKPVGNFVVSHSGAENYGTQRADIGKNELLKVGLRIGGAGPGGPEMSHKQLGGALTSPNYQQNGPHYIGKVLKDGSLCIEPSAMEVAEKYPTDPRDYIIQDRFRSCPGLYSKKVNSSKD